MKTSNDNANPQFNGIQMSIIVYPKKDDKIHIITREELPISVLNQKLLDKISTYSLVND